MKLDWATGRVGPARAGGDETGGAAVVEPAGRDGAGAEAADGDRATAGSGAGPAKPSRASKSARAWRARADIWVRPVSQRFTVAKDTPSR